MSGETPPASHLETRWGVRADWTVCTEPGCRQRDHCQQETSQAPVPEPVHQGGGSGALPIGRNWAPDQASLGQAGTVLRCSGGSQPGTHQLLSPPYRPGREDGEQAGHGPCPQRTHTLVDSEVLHELPGRSQILEEQRSLGVEWQCGWCRAGFNAALPTASPSRPESTPVTAPGPRWPTAWLGSVAVTGEFCLRKAALGRLTGRGRPGRAPWHRGSCGGS